MTIAAKRYSADAPTAVRAGSPELEALISAIAEGASERDRTRTLPFEAVDLIRKARLGALRIPISNGGGGASIRELFQVVIALAEADPNVAHILRNHFAFADRFAQPGKGDGHVRWRDLVAGGAIFGLASAELSQARVGTASLEADLSPAPNGDGYLLNGVKYYSTGSIFADYILVRAEDPSGRLVSIVLPADAPGLTLEDDWDGLGQRLTGTGTTRLQDVPVPATHALFDDEGVAFTRPYYGALQQLYLTGVIAGILRGAANDATALVSRRGRSFEHAPSPRPSDDPILQQGVGDIVSAAFAAEATVLAAADALDRSFLSEIGGVPDLDLAHAASLAAAKAKVVVDALAGRAGTALFDVGGASATKQSANLDRHWRNARTLASHNPASYKAQLIGKHAVTGVRLPSTGFF